MGQLKRDGFKVARCAVERLMRSKSLQGEPFGTGERRLRYPIRPIHGRRIPRRGSGATSIELSQGEDSDVYPRFVNYSVVLPNGDHRDLSSLHRLEGIRYLPEAESATYTIAAQVDARLQSANHVQRFVS